MSTPKPKNIFTTPPSTAIVASLDTITGLMPSFVFVDLWLVPDCREFGYNVFEKDMEVSERDK